MRLRSAIDPVPLPPLPELTQRAREQELVTCNDQPPVGDDATRQPRATYHVYAAYGNTSGLMVPVSRHCDFADAFASYVGQPLRAAV